MIDGYTRLQAFWKVVLPQASTGIAATAIFCLIFSWNEYAFAVLLTSGEAQTTPPFIPFIIGEGGQDWPAVAAGHHAVPHSDRRLHHPAAQTAAARHHLRGGAAMSVETSSIRNHVARCCGPDLPPRAVGESRDDPDRRRRGHADAAGLDRSLHLFLRHDSWPGPLMFMIVTQVSGVRRTWLKSGSITCTRPSAISSPCGFELHRGQWRVLLPAGAVRLRQDDDACA